MPTVSSVFNEPTVYQSVLSRWRKSRDPELRALAINLTSEHRVTPEQEQEFRRFFEPLTTA